MVSTVHEHGFVQSRHPGCSFWQKHCQPFGNVGGRFRGLGSFANHRSKNMAFFSHFETLQTFPRYNRAAVKHNTAQGKFKHCWLERCGNIALVQWWHVEKKRKRKERKESKCTFLFMVAQAGNEQRWWLYVRDCGWLCRENVNGAVEKPELKFPKRALTLKASLFLSVYSGTKLGLVKGPFWKSL